MPSFSESIFLFVLALLLFGPKKLPVLARELGKWMGEFRRASNEFKMQMEEELRASEREERQKQIAAIEAAAPIPPPLEEPQLPGHRSASGVDAGEEDTAAADDTRPVPIATSGELKIMPPASGLPTPRSGRPYAAPPEPEQQTEALPAVSVNGNGAHSEPESAAHGR